MTNVAWDNIDAKLSTNAMLLPEKNVDWHGTIMIAEQMPISMPLLASTLFRNIDSAMYPKPLDLAKKPSSDANPVSAFGNAFFALAAAFRKKAIATESSRMASIDFVPRFALMGSCSGEPALIFILDLLDMLSNSAETADMLLMEQ